MTPALFDVLVIFVTLDMTIIHVPTVTLEPGERLAITLSYLASGQDTFLLLRHIELKDHVIKTLTKADWECIAERFKSWRKLFNYKGTFSVALLTVVDSD
ncbi:hypothetical protein MRX96_004558 [Rhipicephalus microplus]